METILDIALLATYTETKEEAVRSLNDTDSWQDFADMVNDPRVFEVDTEYSVEQLQAELA